MGFIRLLGAVLCFALAFAAKAESKCPGKAPKLEARPSAPGQCTDESAQKGNDALDACIREASGDENLAKGFEKSGKDQENFARMKTNDALDAVKRQATKESSQSYSEAAMAASGARSELRNCAGSSNTSADSYDVVDSIRKLFETKRAAQCQGCMTAEALEASERAKAMRAMTKDCSSRASDMRQVQSDAERNSGKEASKSGEEVASEKPKAEKLAEEKMKEKGTNEAGLQRDANGNVIGPDGKPMSMAEAEKAIRSAREADIRAASEGRNDGNLVSLKDVGDKNKDGLPDRPYTYGEGQTWREPKAGESGVPKEAVINRTGYTTYDNSPKGTDRAGAGAVWRRSDGQGGTHGVNNYGSGSLGDPLTVAASPKSGFKSGDMLYDSNYGWLRVENQTSGSVPGNTVDYWLGKPKDSRVAWKGGFTGSTSVLHFPGGVVAPRYRNLGRNSPLPGEEGNKYRH
jgi:hypothetical protein